MNRTNEWAATFLGGLNLPARGRRPWSRRSNVTMPLALLRVSSERLALLTAPGLPRLEATRAEVVACFRLRPVPLVAHGIGIELADGSVAYFWTYRPRAVLERLRGLGWPVEREPRTYGLARYLGLKD